MHETFDARGIESARLCSELLMSHVIGCERLKLYTDPDRPATELERENLRSLVKRALDHEPIQYLVGEAWFFGLPFTVDRRVLIPRPATETICEHVLQHERVNPLGTRATGSEGDGLLIADVCTGSGCIAVALAKRLPGARVIATDLSEEALEVAQLNAQKHGVADRIDFLQGDLLAPLLDHPVTRGRGSIDYLVSNPPYIPDHEWQSVLPNVKAHEPEHALRGGADGLDFVRPLIAAGADLVADGGRMLVEVAASRAHESTALMGAALPKTEILADAEGLDRVIVGSKP